MKCKKCGKIMVVEDLNTINASSPPSQWMICKCGHRDLEYEGGPLFAPKSWQERWEEENEKDIQKTS